MLALLSVLLVNAIFSFQVLRDRVVVTEEGPRYVAEILVRKVPDDRQCIDLRVCIMGSADVGKSTLLGKY